MASDETIDVEIWQGDAGGGDYRAYTVPAQRSQTVLDVVTWVQQNVEPDLTYRFACRVGMCGSCAMNVNGKPRWTCRTHVSNAGDGPLRIAPLRNLPVIKDLVCDMTEFFDKWVGAGGVFKPSATRDDPMPAIDPTMTERAAASEAIECINCAICYSACDAVAQNDAYFGPAALNRSWSLINDVRDAGKTERLTAAAGIGGCFNCHSQQGCASHCPNLLNPTLSIAGLKRAAVKAKVRGEI